MRTLQLCLTPEAEALAAVLSTGGVQEIAESIAQRAEQRPDWRPGATHRSTVGVSSPGGSGVFQVALTWKEAEVYLVQFERL